MMRLCGIFCFVAAANGHTAVVKLLCEHGARLSPNASGNTAIRKCQSDIFDSLL